MLNLFLLFVLGHMVIAGVAKLATYLFRRPLKLVTRRDAIFELNSKPHRIEAGEAELVRTNTEVSELDHRIGAIKCAIAHRVRLDDPPSAKYAFLLVGLLLAELEAIVFLLLSGPSAFLSLPIDGWALMSPPIAAGWILLLHVLVGAAVSDNHRPARTIRRAKAGVLVGGFAVIVGAWMTLSGRSLTDTATIEQIAGLGLAVLAALVSLTSAFCLIVSTTLFEAEHPERELVRLERLRHDYDRHIELITRDLARLTDADLPSPSGGATIQMTPTEASADVSTISRRGGGTLNTVAPRGIVPTLALIAALGIGTGDAKAQARLQADTFGAQVVGAVLAGRAGQLPIAEPRKFDFARDGACEISIDISHSDDGPRFKAALLAIGDNLSLIAGSLRCSLIRISSFAADPFASLEEVEVPASPGPLGGCGGEDTTTARGRAVAVLYPGVAASHERQRAAECTRQRLVGESRIENRRRAALDTVRHLLSAVATSKRLGPCTAIPQAIGRALMRSQNVIVITDGVTTCQSPTRATQIPPNGSLLFLLVPPSDGGSSDRANSIVDYLAAIERDYSGARALLAPEATSAFWRHSALAR